MVIQTTHTLCLMSQTLGMKYQGLKNNNNNNTICIAPVKSEDTEALGGARLNINLRQKAT